MSRGRKASIDLMLPERILFRARLAARQKRLCATSRESVVEAIKKKGGVAPPPLMGGDLFAKRSNLAEIERE